MAEFGLYKSDSLASEIITQWEMYARERDVYLQRISELRAYLTAPDIKHTKVGDNAMDYKHKTVTPKLTHIYDVLSAKYISTLHPDESWLSFEGSNAEDMAQEDLVETYMRHKLTESKFIVTERELISDWIWTGNVCGGVEHVHEKANSFTSNEEITTYYGAKAFRVSPYDYVVNPRADSFDKSVFIRKRFIPRSDIVNYDNESNLIQYNAQSIDNVYNITTHANSPEETYKDADLKVDGFAGPREYLESGMCVILEFWGDIYDPSTGQYLKNHTIGIADNMFTLWNQPNPMWNGKRPYSFTGWRNRPGNLYSQSPLEQLMGLQYRIDHLENTKADILDQTLHPTIDVIGDMTEDYETGPNVINYLGNEGKAVWNRPDASALQINSEIYNIMNLMEEFSGAIKDSVGIRSPGEKTAFEVSQLNQGAMEMHLEKTRHWEMTFLNSMMHNFYTLTAMNFNIEDAFKVLDDITGATEVISVKKEQVIRDGNFKLKGSENFAKKNKILLDLRDGLGLLLSNETTAMHVDGLAIDKMVERELDWEKYGIIKDFAAVTAQIDAQFAAQMHQKEMQQVTGEGIQQSEQPGQTQQQAPSPVQ